MTAISTRFSGKKGYLLALLAGAIYPLGFAPVNQWYLIILSIALLALLLHDCTPRQAAVKGWLYGLGLYGVGVSWVFVSIQEYGGTQIYLSVLLTLIFVAGIALFFSIQAWCYQKLNLSWLSTLTFPALWVIFEWVRTWALTGFPWILGGYGFIDTPLRNIAPVFGVLGISFTVALAAMLISRMLMPPGSYPTKYRITAALSLVLLLAAAWSSDINWTRPVTSQPVQFSLIQGNISQEKKWDPSERENIINTYKNLTFENPDKDIIIWPEAAYPVYYQEAIDTTTELNAFAISTNTALISGAPFWEHNNHEFYFFNSIFVIGKGGGLYHKQKLVPFGEYVPLEFWIRGLVPFFDLPLSSFTRGSYEQKPLLAKGYTLAPFICYEIVYPDFVRNYAKNSEFLVTISNDAWFGHSWGPAQHFQMARMRALEAGKFLLRATNTGITAIVDQRGLVQSRLPQFQEAVLNGVAFKTEGTTPFMRWGSWPVLSLVFILCLAGIWGGRRKKTIP